MTAWSKRVRIGIDWAFQAVFPRDLVHLKTATTERVSHAYYRPGEYVFRRGEQAAHFYVIERGEVEILRDGAGPDGSDVLAVLGPGDFFGEMALLEGRERSASARARTTLELGVVGRNVFAQISATLAPLRDILADAMRRRNADVWSRLPVAHGVLGQAPLSAFVEPPPAAHLRPQSTFAETIRLFADARVDACYVLDDRDYLCGVVTRLGLLQAVERLIVGRGADPRTLRVEEFMAANPVVVTPDDASLGVAATLREHMLTSVPVVGSRSEPRLAGHIRTEALLAWVLEHVPEEVTANAA
jgi:signal-transduction protein with cAMP-binding, CBS, and nucleotidyltransferase domain